MRRRLILFLFAACAGLLSGPVLAEPVFPPGLRIGLEPPGDMTVSKRFAGFEDFDRKAAITIIDLPARAYQDIERSAFAQNQKSLSNVKRESFPFASGIGILVTGASVENGVTVHKWFLMATTIGEKVRDLAMLVNVQIPETARKVYSDAVIRKALASVSFRPAPIQERLGMLPFELNELSGFRVMQVLPTGGVILVEGPDDDITRHPYMIISADAGAPSNTDDRGRFARNLLASAPLINLRIQLAEPMRITGSPGFEIRAQAEGPHNISIAMVQWTRFTGNGYLRIIGVAAKDKWDEMFTRFRAVRDGIAFR
ncbi:MAG TPA: hypothetical protein VIJ78_01965 [Pseudolabrys sp.]